MEHFFQSLTLPEWLILDAVGVFVVYLVVRAARPSSRRIEPDRFMGVTFWGVLGVIIVVGGLALWVYGTGRWPKP